MTHAPWQLEMYSKPSLQCSSSQPQPPQLATPAVERLLPIGGSRSCMHHGKSQAIILLSIFHLTCFSFASLGTKTSTRFQSDDVGYGSPESPLSKMEVMTIGTANSVLKKEIVWEIGLFYYPYI